MQEQRDVKHSRELEQFSETVKKMATCIHSISISGDLVGASSKTRENSSRRKWNAMNNEENGENEKNTLVNVKGKFKKHFSVSESRLEGEKKLEKQEKADG